MHRQAATADLLERFGVSASAAIAGRITWAELSDLVRALLADPSSRLCASANKWSAPLDEHWLLRAILQSIPGVEITWPWLATPEADEAAIWHARESLLARWGGV